MKVNTDIRMIQNKSKNNNGGKIEIRNKII